MKRSIRLVVLSLVIFGNALPSIAQKPKKNIVLIMADDFNYWNGVTKYYPGILTPNLDKLAQRGVLFADAQAAAPVCNPSRQAMWSGFRPSTSGIEGNEAPWIRATPGFEKVVTMNQYFNDNGYHTWGVGKLYHSKFGETGKTNDDTNWSTFSTSLIGGSKGPQDGRYWQVSAPDDEYKWSVNPATMTTANCNDFNVASQTAAKINGYAAAKIDKPFFIACGVSKPHLAWDVPLQFYSKYVTENMLPPAGYKVNDLNDTSEGSDGSFAKIVDAGKWDDAIHMYAASLSLADHNAGLIINAVENSIYKDNTIIVFMGDHGWILGEKTKFGKASPWDMANKTTLIIYDPSYKNNSTTNTRVCKKVVSLQDIYPTLVELSGLPIKTDIEGNSIAALVENPAKEDWDKPVAVTRQFDRIRTNKWSYCDMDGDGGANPTTRDMLYDIENDPHEWVNMLHSTYTGMPRADVLKIRTRLVTQLDSIKNIGSNMKSKLLTNYKFTPKSLTIPGTIEAEDYDEGGYGQTHFDADKVNAGGQYRTADATDIYTTSDTGGLYHLGGLSTGEWMNYSVKEYLAGKYTVDFRVKNTGASPAVVQIFNRDVLLGEFSIPASTNSWASIQAPEMILSEQNSTRLQVKIKSGTGVEFNNMKFSMSNLSNPEITANIKRKCLTNTVVTDGTLHLDLYGTDTITTVSVYDINGKLVSKNKVLGEQIVAYSLSQKLSPGVYLLRVEDDFVSSVEKFIVK